MLTSTFAVFVKSENWTRIFVNLSNKSALTRKNPCPKSKSANIVYPQQEKILVQTASQTHQNKTWCTLVVQDSGTGIVVEEESKIFNLFYRGEAARDFTIPGAGLGLAIGKEIMERLNGRLTLHTIPGQRAAFTLWLPSVEP